MLTPEERAKRAEDPTRIEFMQEITGLLKKYAMPIGPKAVPAVQDAIGVLMALEGIMIVGGEEILHQACKPFTGVIATAMLKNLPEEYRKELMDKLDEYMRLHGASHHTGHTRPHDPDEFTTRTSNDGHDK